MGVFFNFFKNGIQLLFRFNQLSNLWYRIVTYNFRTLFECWYNSMLVHLLWKKKSYQWSGKQVYNNQAIVENKLYVVKVGWLTIIVTIYWNWRKMKMFWFSNFSLKQCYHFNHSIKCYNLQSMYQTNYLFPNGIMMEIYSAIFDMDLLMVLIWLYPIWSACKTCCIHFYDIFGKIVVPRVADLFNV